MTWVLVVGATWVTLAVAAALLFGRAIHLADRRAAVALADVERAAESHGHRRTLRQVAPVRRTAPEPSGAQAAERPADGHFRRSAGPGAHLQAVQSCVKPERTISGHPSSMP